MAVTISRTLRTRALRRHHATKFVWWYLASHLDLTAPQVIKVRPTAAALDIERRTMRRALRLLVLHRYLDVVVRPTRGTPGEYVAGPRAYRKPVTAMPVPAVRRGHRGPRPHPDQLALDIASGEGLDYAA